MLLDSSERSVVVEAFRSGASGILSREQSFDIMCKYAVCQGQVWASNEEVHYTLETLSQNDMVTATKFNKNRTVLTNREESIVRLVQKA